MKKIIVFVVIGFVGVFLFIVPDAPIVERQIQQRGWSAISAQVQDVVANSLPMSASKTRFRISVEYSYQYNAKTYISSDIQNSDMILPAGRTEQEVREYMLGTYPKGRVLEVRINPNNPNQSTVPKFHELSLPSVIIGCAMVVVSIVIIGLEILKQNRRM